MTKDKDKFIVEKSKLNTSPKMRKRLFAKRAEGSRISNQHQVTWDQIEPDEDKE